MTMRVMFLSEKVDACCRLVISSRRGCRHVPGLSVVGVVGALVGVDTAVCAVFGAIEAIAGWCGRGLRFGIVLKWSGNIWLAPRRLLLTWSEMPGREEVVARFRSYGVA